MVRKPDGGIGFDNLEAHDSLFHQRGKERALGLQLLRTAAEAMCDARYEKHNDWQHGDDKQRQTWTDIKKHGGVEQHTHDSHHQLLHRRESAFVIFHHVAPKACQHIPFAMGMIVSHGQMHSLMKKVVADVAHHAATHRCHLHCGKIAKKILAGV